MEAIKKQIEYYFSTSNFRRDAFLKSACASGPMPVAQLLAFNKLTVSE